MECAAVDLHAALGRLRRVGLLRPRARPFGLALTFDAWPWAFGNTPSFQKRFLTEQKSEGALLVQVSYSPRLCDWASRGGEDADDIGVLWFEGDWLRFRGDWIEMDLSRADVLGRRRRLVTAGIFVTLGADYELKLDPEQTGCDAVRFHTRDGSTLMSMMLTGHSLRRGLGRWVRGEEV